MRLNKMKESKQQIKVAQLFEREKDNNNKKKKKKEREGERAGRAVYERIILIYC